MGDVDVVKLFCTFDSIKTLNINKKEKAWQ